MYQSLLTRRYLTSKIMPLLSIVAVALCVWIVLVVWSVMGGFLVLLLDMGKRLEGDVSIVWPTVGFGHYEDLMQRLGKDPLVQASAPMLESYGMISMPDDRVKAVQVQGIDSRYANVSDYAGMLWWKPLDKPLPKDTHGLDIRLDPDWPQATERMLLSSSEVRPFPHGTFRSWEQMYKDGLRLEVKDPKTGQLRGAAVAGIELSTFNHRMPGQWYQPGTLVGTRAPGGTKFDQSGFLPAHEVTINVLPFSNEGRMIKMATMRLPVANEFRSGFFEADNRQVFVNLADLQKLLDMEGGQRLEATPGPFDMGADSNGKETFANVKVVGAAPARVTTVLVRGKPGVDPEQLRNECKKIYAEFAASYKPGEVPSSRQITISTWARSHATFIDAVQHETTLVLTLLLGLSFVAVFLILAIFWSMVSEKTRDIGVLRAVGGSRAGVAWVWLRYGITIGVVGSAVGGAIAYLTVHYINPIHEWMGRVLHVTIWDPNVYYFTEIPHHVVTSRAVLVIVGGVAFSVLGALIPAIKAAYMDPVRALRFE